MMCVLTCTEIVDSKRFYTYCTRDNFFFFQMFVMVAYLVERNPAPIKQSVWGAEIICSDRIFTLSIGE